MTGIFQKHIIMTMTHKKITLTPSHYTEDSLMYHVDSYCGLATQGNAIDVVGYQDNIKVTGWVFLKNEKKTLKSIYLRINENIYKAIYHLDRKDVGIHFNAKSVDKCGFLFEIETALIPEQSYDFEIIGEDRNGNFHISELYTVKMAIQTLFVPSGNENIDELHHAIKLKEQEVTSLHEILYTKNKQIFDIYNSKTWQLNKKIFANLNILKSLKSSPANNGLCQEPQHNEY